MSAIEKAFGVRAGHRLRLVRTEALGGEAREWEHEERARDGRLIALYESWFRGAASPAGGRGGGGGLVKYLPNGWVMRRSNAATGRRA